MALFIYGPLENNPVENKQGIATGTDWVWNAITVSGFLSREPLSKAQQLCWEQAHRAGEGKGYPGHHKCHQNMLGTLLPRGILLGFSTSSNATSTQESEKEMEAVVKLSLLLLPSTWKNTQKDWRAHTGKKTQMMPLKFFFHSFMELENILNV